MPAPMNKATSTNQATKADRSPRPDVGGLLLSVLAVGSLVYTLIKAPQVGWLSNRTVYGFSISWFTAFAFIAWEYSADHPMLDVERIRNARRSRRETGSSPDQRNG